MYNRQNEPNWYRYYRCCHYGYHPTQWAPWPEGWLTCRSPEPGEHPYDYHPPRPDQKTLDRERRLSREAQGPDDRREPERLDDPLEKPEDAAPPKLVPPTNSTSPPGPPTPAPAEVPVPPAPESLPMPMP